MQRNSGMFWGFILILFGLLFLLDNFYYIDFGDVVSTYWPLILVVIGLKIIWDKYRYQNKAEEPSEKSESGAKMGAKTHRDGISESNVFGDINLRLESEQFRGGSLNNVFGDIKLDISEVDLAEGTTKVFISGIFGDTTVVAPKNVPIKTRANCVAGDITIRGIKKDGMFLNLNEEEINYETANKKLYIQSSIIFGSISIF
jgi:predicted membrane protein